MSFICRVLLPSLLAGLVTAMAGCTPPNMRASTPVAGLEPEAARAAKPWTRRCVVVTARYVWLAAEASISRPIAIGLKRYPAAVESSMRSALAASPPSPLSQKAATS